MKERMNEIDGQSEFFPSLQGMENQRSSTKKSVQRQNEKVAMLQQSSSALYEVSSNLALCFTICLHNEMRKKITLLL